MISGTEGRGYWTHYERRDKKEKRKKDNNE